MPDLPASTSRQLLAVLAVVALAVVGLIAWRWSAAPTGAEAQIEVLDEGRAVTGLESADTEPAPESEPATITVHVTGPVAAPGVVVLPEGSRVVDAITASGGMQGAQAASGLNLARVLTDGELVDVGAPTAAGGPSGSPTAAGLGTGVNLNTATAADLQELPGVGPVLAERILAYREQHGSFDTVEQLQEVSGIGPSRYAEISALVGVG